MIYADNENWPAPGVYANISAAKYHATKAVSSSLLKSFKNLPATCRDPFVPTWESVLGSASHAYSIEGPDVFHSQYVIAPEFLPPADFTGKKWKATDRYKNMIAEFQAKQIGNGKEILDDEQGRAVLSLDKSLRENPASRRFLDATSEGELSVLWIDKGTGLLCKARVDWYIDEMPVDYKTTGQIDRFYSQMLSLNYDVQGGWYSAGLLANDLNVRAFCFLVGETADTYRIRSGYLGGGENGREWLDAAIDESKRLVGLYKECLDSDTWPNYRIPAHIFSLDQITEADLLEEWVCPRGRYGI